MSDKETTPEQADAGDAEIIENGKLHEFPPIGKKLVGPLSEWEALPGDMLRHRPLPYDPKRTWRVVPSDWKP